MNKKKENKKDLPKVHAALEGLDVNINEFGEVKTNFSIDKINTFLNKNVDDKKLKKRNDKKNKE